MKSFFIMTLLSGCLFFGCGGLKTPKTLVNSGDTSKEETVSTTKATQEESTKETKDNSSSSTAETITKNEAIAPLSNKDVSQAQVEVANLVEAPSGVELNKADVEIQQAPIIENNILIEEPAGEKDYEITILGQKEETGSAVIQEEIVQENSTSNRRAGKPRAQLNYTPVSSKQPAKGRVRVQLNSGANNSSQTSVANPGDTLTFSTGEEDEDLEEEEDEDDRIKEIKRGVTPPTIKSLNVVLPSRS